MIKVLTALLAAAIWAVGTPGAAQAPGYTVVLTVEQVHSSAGKVIGALCGDRKGQFPGGCLTYYARADAKPGAVELTFTGVKPGAYAVQVFHDENNDGRPEIPPEGFAYGNNTAYPPSFDAASITVAGDTRARVSLTYLTSAAMQPAQGSGAPAPAGVTKTDVRDHGLFAELYVPAHERPLPVIVMVGGSEGGLDTISRMAVSFTAHGYAVLALAYWGEPGLPQKLEDVPLEYFDAALAWLAARPEIDARRIGLIGWSRGSEAALLTAARNPAIRAVVAVSPSNMVWQGLDPADYVTVRPAWTLRGAAVPFVSPSTANYQANAPLRTVFEPTLAVADAHPEAMIPVERIHGPILLLSGDDDHLWPSSEMAERIMARLKAKRFGHAYQHLSYPGAGHVVFVGDPKGRAGANPAGLANASMGGTAAGYLAAWADDWPKTLTFLDDALKH